MRVRDVMTAGVQACHPEDTLADATARIWKSGSDWLPVTDWEDRLLGQISESDVQAALDRNGRAATEVPVSEAMSHNVRTCSPEDEIQETLHLMRESGSMHLPVIDPNRKLLGVFSLKALLEQRKESGENMGISDSELLEFSYGDL
ncbi:MAG TPA: CBS domain-containing protein [Bryobacteraceae bacterium]|jgi:CBS-domain-containing membrane protein